jgi:2-oxo-3-hexenedioate decarboxylase/2-keto-4-pentenoate hydratase
MAGDLAAALAAAFVNDELVAALPDDAVVDEAAARRLQAAVIARLDLALGGWKVGATSAKAQVVMGTDMPFYGPVFRERIWADGALVDLPAGFRGVECEFALRIGADLPPRPGGYGIEQLVIAVDAVVPALELVATRQRVEGMADARRAAADLGFNHGLVLGPPLMPPPTRELADASAVARVDGVEVMRGSGADVLGHPLEAVAWLTRQGVALPAGALVSTGACTGLTPLRRGETVEADFGPLGRVRASAA